MTDTQWGRKETIVRPPHYPVHSFGAVFISLFVIALCIYLHFAFVMSPLQRYYVPCYLETGFLGTMRQSSDYQLVTVADRQHHARPVTKDDVQPGSTPQPTGDPIPLALSQAPALRESFPCIGERRSAIKTDPFTCTCSASFMTATAFLQSSVSPCGPAWQCSFCSFRSPSAKMSAD